MSINRKVIRTITIITSMIIGLWSYPVDAPAGNRSKVYFCDDTTNVISTTNTNRTMRQHRRDTALLMFYRADIGGTWRILASNGYTVELCRKYDSLNVYKPLFPDTAYLYHFIGSFLVGNDTVHPREFLSEVKKATSYCNDCPILGYRDKKYENVIQQVLDPFSRYYVFNQHVFNLLKCAYTYYDDGVRSIQQVNYGMKYGDTVYLERRIPVRVISSIKILDCGLKTMRFYDIP
ncbi:MAG: hypothetical protein JNL32_11700 [Candidatus Kapabacteria bacterium]|nr:hypothetical protein [Candidatus Kapabacteria bacterium]